VVICLEQSADLHIGQLMPLPVTVSSFSKIQIGFTFLVPAHPGSLGKRAVKRVRKRVRVSGTCPPKVSLLVTSFLGPVRGCVPNSISIGSAVLQDSQS